GQLNILTIGGGILIIGLIFYLFNLSIKFLNFSTKNSMVMTITMYWFLLLFNFIPILNSDGLNEAKTNIQLNKSKFLSEQAFDYFMYNDEYYFDFYLRSVGDDMNVKKEYTDLDYPFLHKADYPDVLSPYFDSVSTAPDIVFILVESLGKAYSGKDAYLGSFTPFLDSLESHSLVWTNAISSTGRTFGLLPGLFAGLPYGEKGFLELYQDYPLHESLLSILKDNGYNTSFFTGSDLSFDNERNFLEYAKVDQLIESKNFPPEYEKMASTTGFTWGYGDKELFRHGISIFPPMDEKPQLGIFQ